MSPRTFQNPIVPGFQPDPSVCRVGEDFYLVTSSFELFPGLPIHHSRDLVNWRLIGHAFSRAEQFDFRHTPASKGMFAPTLRHHNGRFYLICTDVDHFGNFILHAEDPAGPWSDPVAVDAPGIDPSLFFHDGRVWFTGSAPDQAGILGGEIDPVTGCLLTPLSLWWKGTGGRFPEGPHLYFRNGWFYLLISEGGTEFAHAVTVARSCQPEGPYESSPHNPVLTHRGLDHPLQSTGHADMVQDAVGGWWMVFLAVRHIGYPHLHHLGRETCLAPVRWTQDGWPVVDTPLPAMLPVPAGFSEAPARAEVSPWVFRRTPPEGLSSLEPGSGNFSLPCLPPTLTAREPVALIARRQTAFIGSFSAVLTLSPEGERGDMGGLAAVMNERYHAFCGIERQEKEFRLIARQQFADVSAVLAEKPWPAPSARLGIVATATHLRFEVDSRPFAQIETRHLSTELAGGFTGVLLGCHASSQGRSSTGGARFSEVDWTFPLNP